jgi:cytochrome b involved in lipid metabolism
MKKILIISAFALLAVGCNSSTVQNQTPAQQTPPGQLTTYTMAEVQAANKPEKCWTAIRGNVYDLTKWIDKHPGGDKNILKLCGLDGTQAFEKKHGGQEKQEITLAGFEIGKLK